MSMCGHLTKKDKERWAEKNRQAVADSVNKTNAEKQNNSQPGSPGYRPGSTAVTESHAPEIAGQDAATLRAFIDNVGPPNGSEKSWHPSDGAVSGAHGKQAGTDCCEEGAAARTRHRQKMQDAHLNRFKDAHWTHSIPIIESAKAGDVYMETVGHRMYGSNKKFVMAPQQISVSRAPRDVDNHLYTGAVHKEAESEQEIIARKVENHQIEINDHKGREALKDEMDNLRRSRSSKWTDKAIPTSDGEVPL